MQPVLRNLGCLVLAVSVILQIYLRIYPSVRSGCSWPKNHNPHSEDADIRVAAFGDPQIVGYSPKHNIRKKVDIYGNDLFLKQIASTIRSQRKPDYVAVMGDLLSSQWIPTDEFHRRVDRFANIFPSSDKGQLVNVSGNHDIGYHGEFNEDRLSRFEERFGKLNYIVKQVDVDSDPSQSYRIVVLNSLSSDGPPYHDAAQNNSVDFLKSLQGFQGSTSSLTHIPLHKPAGICRDGPHFEYYAENYGSVSRQQNHSSSNASNFVSDSVFSTGRGGSIATGHDHEGCSTRYTSQSDGTWVPEKDLDSTKPENNGDGQLAIVKEFTVRSMMGEFGGNCGLITGRSTPSHGIQWTYTSCRFHIQHIWWITQICTILGSLILPLSYSV